MKKLWTILLALMLVGSLLVGGALAEGLVEEADGEQAILAEAAVAEEEEFVIGENDPAEDNGYAEFVFDGGEYAVEAAVPEFEIDANGTLVKYNGTAANVVIPDTVKKIGDWAFVEYEEYTETWEDEDGETYTDSWTEVTDNTTLTSVVIPASVTEISWAAFRQCVKLSSVTFSEGLVTIQGQAFYGCEALGNIVLPNSVTTIGSDNWGAFEQAHGLTSITLGAGLKAIPEWAFNGCYKLTSVVIPEGVATIGYYAFGNCEALTSVTLPSTLTTIGSYAFASCTGLTYIEIPANVTSIGDNAFEYCEKLATVVIHSAYVETPKVVYYDDDGNVEEEYYPTDVFYDTPETLAVYGYCHSNVQAWAQTQKRTNFGLMHTPYVDPYIAPTFTTTGLTEGSHCYYCGTVLVAQQVLPISNEFHMTGKATANVDKGRVFQIAVDGKEVKSYASSDKKIAKVSKTGVVTAKKAGTAKVTITLKNKKKITLKVKVTDPTIPTKISLAEGKKAYLKVGETLQLNAILEPGTASSKLTWKSSDKKIAKVSSTGLVTAKKAGKVKITVTTKNKKKTTITVKVSK